jgi:hypothetical protein
MKDMLKDVDVTKIGRLSLKGLKLPAQEVRIQESEMNYEQLALKRRLEICINRNDTGFFGVFGPGGTGKTHTVTRISGVENFLFLAPTNKAAKIVSENLYKIGIDKKCITIDRYLGYKKEKDEFDQDLIKYTDFEKLHIPKVIVIDEVSMMNDDHVSIFIKISKKAFIILIGDKMQIPPVRDNDKKTYDKQGFECSKIFTEIEDSFDLTVQNRQNTKSNLYRMINYFRSIMHQKINFQEFISKYINQNDILMLDFNAKEFNEYVKKEKPIAVCYKNMTSYFFCYKIIKSITGKSNFKEITIGSVYYFTKSCITQEKTFYTSETVRIISIDLVEKEIQMPVFAHKWKYNYSELTVQCLETLGIYKIYLSNPKATSAIYSYKKNKINSYPLTSQEKAKINTWYQKYLNSFAKLSLTVSLTAHKSQGSTFEKVMIPIYDFADYRDNYKSFNQLFYTAISRAKGNIIFVNGKSNFNENSKRPIQWTEEEKKFILELNDYQCNECKKLFKTDRDFEIHHIVSLEKGGNNNPKNLTPVCKECHKILHKL